jgi:hypothetical protein
MARPLQTKAAQKASLLRFLTYVSTTSNCHVITIYHTTDNNTLTVITKIAEDFPRLTWGDI